MPIRVGFDVDGVVADFASAYRDIEQRLFDDRVGRPAEPER
jgi:beta-phosphoglucomutase-like phosphatase (HAD superfamily)